MAKDWFVNQDGNTFGPYTSGRLKEFVSAGRISPDAKVANSSDGPWHPISKIKGLEIPPPLDSPHASTHSSVNTNQSQPGSTTSESAVWSGRPSQITNLQSFILCFIFFLLIFPIFIAIWRWLVVRCIQYEMTTQRLQVTQGVLSRRTDELELYRVKDTAFGQTFFQRIFGLGSIFLRTSDVTTPLVTIDSIEAEEAKQLREQIRVLTEELRDRKRVREVDFT